MPGENRGLSDVAENGNIEVMVTVQTYDAGAIIIAMIRVGCFKMTWV
jgi:hypothetical protein